LRKHQSRTSKFVDVDAPRHTFILPFVYSNPGYQLRLPLTEFYLHPDVAASRQWEIQHHRPKWRLAPWKSRAATV